jgi:VWFA-related protein
MTTIARHARSASAATAIVAAVALQPAAPRAQPLQDQVPRFRASVEVTSLDVSVVDDRGQPITDLKPEDFSVRIEGAVRRVTSAEFVALTSNAAAPAPAPPDGYSTNESSTGGRLIVIAVDEPNIRFGGALAISKAANAFIDRLLPSDRIAVTGFGRGSPSTPFTADHDRTKRAIARMVGQKEAGKLDDLGFNVGLAEAMQVDRGDLMQLESIKSRECQTMPPGPATISCRDTVEMQVRLLAQNANRESDQTIVALREVLTGLRRIEGAKTLIFISEGFVLADTSVVVELGSLAAAARTSLYALRLDSQLFDISDPRLRRDPFADRHAQGQGLELLAGAARGTLFDVIGTGAALFDRIESEISGYYLIGVESDPKDRDGKPHAIRVDVQRRGAQVRSRRQMINASADAPAARSTRQAVGAALSSPLIVSALPLRVASFALKGPERDRVQVLIHADIGSDYAASKVVSAAYVISDKDGRMVDNKAFDARLLPIMSGVPSALQYKAGASLPPGDYTLKLAVADGDRVGSIEHEIHAALPQAEPEGLAFSELMVGGPVDIGELLQPTIGYQITFGAVHGYFEAYGPRSADVSVEYEIATDDRSPALINVDVPARPAGDARTIFSRVMPVHQLPPGKYLLRAVVSVKDRAVQTLARGFEVAAPRVLMTSADGLGPSSVDAELFLPTDEAAMVPRFHRDQAIDTETLKPFRARMPGALAETFDRGVALLAAGDVPQAEAAFKQAIQPDVDSTAALAYLAVCFAASGHDFEAASAFQTALVDGSDLPQLYDWLGGALLRNHDFGEARSILEEAIAKWPSDIRFAKPLALLYATFGRGREAVRTLERYLDERSDDRDAYFLGVQWLYTIHSSGAVVHGRAEDLAKARQYADAYVGAKGPQAALVKQWISFLEGEKR